MTNEELLAAINSRFDDVEARLTDIDGRFDGVDTRFDGLDDAFRHNGVQIESIRQKLDAVEEGVENVSEMLGRFKIDTEENFRVVNGRLDVIASIGH